MRKDGAKNNVGKGGVAEKGGLFSANVFLQQRVIHRYTWKRWGGYERGEQMSDQL